MFKVIRSRILRVLGGLTAVIFIAVPGFAAQQGGTVTGIVVDARTNAPIAAVQIYIGNLNIGGLTQPNGRYLLQNIPTGSHTLTAERIGYRTYSEQVTVAGGQTVELNITFETQPLMLEGIVATGLIDPVAGVLSPITVGRVTTEILPITTAGSPLQNLQGRVAGVSVVRESGQPGDDVQIMLRSPTSGAQARFGGDGVGEPLIVVDGVILAQGSGTSNISSSDIASMEVIKGAAAASLYGSRAAAGVISIKTNRGENLALGQTQFTVRSEVGVSQAYRLPEIRTHHPFLMNAAQTGYVDVAGNPITDLGSRVTPQYAFADNPYPGQLFDNLGTVYQAGGFQQHTLSMARNSTDSNLALTLNRYLERGALVNNDGYERTSLRMNADIRFGTDITLAVSGFHSRDFLDNLDVDFRTIAQAPVDVDLSLKVDGEFIRIPDPQVAYENPLWRQASREDERKRARTLGSLNLRWEPLPWLSWAAAASYDHQDESERDWTPKGTPLSVTRDNPSDGSIRYDRGQRDSFNAEAQMSLRDDYLEGLLNVRTTFRGIVERDTREDQVATGTDFFVSGVPSLSASAVQTASSTEEEIRALGLLWDTALEYDQKYIGSVLVRRDGSSLFGPENRWHNYYRAAFAYRLTEEDWFDIEGIDEFKLTYARGTAGGRPAFRHRFETWDVSGSGVSKSSLGNKDLRPEHTIEQEVSVDMVLFRDYGIRLTQAWQETTEQLVRRDIPSFTGYSEQWANGGTVIGHTTEVTVEARFIETPNFSWTSTFVGDRSRGEITDWPFACYNQSYRYICGGTSIYALFSGPFMWDQSMLASHDGGSIYTAGREAEFMKNDDGLLVWVGPGGHYTDQNWGATATISGTTYQWGLPFYWQDPLGARGRPNTWDLSHVNLGWMNNLRFGRLSVFVHLNARVGGYASNEMRRRLLRTGQDSSIDQSGKPEPLKKPLEYYASWAVPGDHTIESGGFLKLRTLSLNYELSPTQLGNLGVGTLGMSSLQLGLVARDLLTLTGYKHADPEGSLQFNDRTGTGATSYPSTRTFTIEVQATF